MVKVVRDHQHRALIIRQGLLQSLLGKGVQMAGGLVQQQQVEVTDSQLSKLQQVLFAAGKLTHISVKTFGIEAVVGQMLLHAGGRGKAQSIELFVNAAVLLQYLLMELGEVACPGGISKADGAVFTLSDLPKHGGLSGAVGSHQGHFFPGVNGEGDVLQQGLLKGKTVVFHL